jgi:hypothetical protein
MAQWIKPRTRETVDPTNHGTPTTGQPSKPPTTPTRSRHHRRTSNTNGHSSTETTRRRAAILAPMQQERHATNTAHGQTNAARNARTNTRRTRDR